MSWPTVTLGQVIRPRKEFITIDDLVTYRRPRVQLHAKGIVERDEVPGALIKTKQQQVCRAGEFLVAEIDAKVGGFGVVPPELDGSIVSSHYFLFAVDENQLKKDFLDYFIRTAAFRNQVEAQGSTNYAAIRPADVLGYEIPLPSLPEQQRVVTVVRALASRIAEGRTLRARAVTETQALMQSRLNTLAAQIDFSGILGDVLRDKPRNGWSARCDNADGGTPVLALGAITGYRYRNSEFKRTSLHAPENGHFWLTAGDLLITRSNTPELVGHAAIYDGTPNPCIYPDLMMRLELKHGAVEPRFVWYWLQSPPARDFIGRKAKGTSPTMKKISQAIVMAIPFPSALPVSQQRQILCELDALQTEVDALQNLQAETDIELNALMPSVLAKAFAGEL